MLRTRLIGVGLLSLLGAASAAAQTTYPSVKVTGRLQTQFYYFGNEDYAATTGPQSNVFLRRARIEAKVQMNEYISAYIQPSFEGGRAAASSSCTSTLDTLANTVTTKCTNGNGGIRLRDAWIDVRLSKPEAPTAFTLRFGQEKRPFSRYELTSSNNLPSIERGAGRGLLAVQSNELFEKQGLLSHDVGISGRVERKLDPSGRMVSLVAGIYNGRGESLNDNNNAKSFGVRASADLWSKLSVGGAYFSHDQILAADSAFRNKGYGVDAQWSKVGEPGLYVLAEVLSGEQANAGRTKMLGIQGLAAYNIRTTSPTSWLYAVEPSLRVDVADPDTDTDNDGATLITGSVAFYMSSKALLRVGVDHQSFQASGAKSITGVRGSMQVSF
ncbi:MAG TPA: porin [Gemmatimonadales bacterium]|nr:porin [Gemmatimonadales bacterium]